MERSNKKGFKELQIHWYQKLQEKGFVDIEDSTRLDRPLKAWHSHRFGGNSGKRDELKYPSLFRVEGFKSQTEEKLSKKKQELGEKIKNTRDFYDLAQTLLHTAKLRTKHFRKVWRLFCEGMSERKISEKTRIPKSTVHWIIARISREIKWK
jgi:hypothetical protein